MRLRFNWLVFAIFPFFLAITLLGVSFGQIQLSTSQGIRAFVCLAWALYCILSTRGMIFYYNED